MPVYQVESRIEQSVVPPKKRTRLISPGWLMVIRVFLSMSIAALLFVLILDISHSDDAFILLPVLLSLFINGSRPYRLDIFRKNIPLYFLLTICLSLVYYTVITVFVLLTHPGSSFAPIIYVTTALAWMIILEPARAYFQSQIEQRFNVRNREALQAIEGFTATLREEIDLDQLREHFLTVIQQAMQPYFIALWTLVNPRQQEPHDDQKRSEITIASDDPIIPFALGHPGLLEIDRFQLNSPVIQHLKANEVELALLLVSQGELIGLLALGLRLNGHEYSGEDRSLLDMLAPQVAPALRVAQMVQQQQEQVRERERIEQELRTAQAIQHAFLPKEIPTILAWQLAPYYQPAREVGGDFYDFFLFADGNLGLIIGDVTGKGIPAALVMATVHTMLRSTVLEIRSPSKVLARVNDLLAADIPAGMFVTCFYAILDPASGHVTFANAGHEPPYRHCGGKARELWASGMPLGLMPETRYEEYADTLEKGETLLFYSDGLVEAHDTKGEMLGFPRLQALLASYPGEVSLIDFLLSSLKNFTGEAWEQEDDITLVTLQRMSMPEKHNEQSEPKLFQETSIASAPGNEQQAMAWVAEVVHPLHLSTDQLENLKTAVAEAVMNAMEHGNHYAPGTCVTLQVLASATSVVVRIRDAGNGKQHPISEPGEPDLEAKLAGQETPRGWGLFLIQRLVDEIHIVNEEHFHMLELIMQLE
jgi:serine phosphatase RsbU (regulator of sigma subunit)/anti-sigma regulatory factor (Ser/Thr protein kinase)